MHRRHLAELVGQDEPKSGLTVHAYNKPFDFEYQVRRHLESAMETWPNANRRKTENRIRRSLAVGSAWLYQEPQMYLDLGDNAADKPSSRNGRRKKARIPDQEEQVMADAEEQDA